MKIKIERSKRGIPCIWESGGGWSNTGDATIIADSKGDPKVPIYIRRAGSLACQNHALIPVEIGDIVVSSHHHRYDFVTEVCKIISISQEYADLELSNRYSKGEWDFEATKMQIELAGVAQEKASTYHCRSAKYVHNDMYEKSLFK